MLSACKAAPIAVQYSEFFGIIKRTSYIFSITGKRSSHCGNRLRLPMSTKSRISLFKELKIVAEPIDCNTKPINPKANASREDIALGLIGLVLQSIGSATILSSLNSDIRDFVLIGNLSLLPQCELLFPVMEKIYDVRFIIPKNSEYCTAIGAALQADKLKKI